MQLNDILRFLASRYTLAVPRRKWRSPRLGGIIGIASLLLAAVSANAATWYVDSAATGANNGTSWANAWTSLTQISGVSSGDTVFISGGPAGSTRTYSQTSAWSPVNGGTYRIAQDSSHNGTAVFKISPSASDGWINATMQNVVISGDAGDGQMHFQLDPSMLFPVFGSGSSNFRFSYVNCGSVDAGFYFNGINGSIEIDHCYLNKVTNAAHDSIGFLNCAGFGFDTVKIHDNEFHAPHSTSADGWGDDFWNGTSWSGVSFYNNKYISYGISNYLASQHQDGAQPLGGDHIKIYNNYFENITNYAVFFNGLAGFSNCYVYNNIISLTESVVQKFASPVGIAIGPQGSGIAFDTIVVANNLVADYGSHRSISLKASGSTTASWKNCNVSNNISLNSPGSTLGIFELDPSITAAHNVALTSLANGGSHFVSYTPMKSVPPNDFHLLSTDTTFKGKGSNLSTYFNTDKDGVTRAQGAAWDIGPYASSGSSAPPSPQNLQVKSN
jgi:hypothetical protein